MHCYSVMNSRLTASSTIPRPDFNIEFLINTVTVAIYVAQRNTHFCCHLFVGIITAGQLQELSFSICKQHLLVIGIDKPAKIDNGSICIIISFFSNFQQRFFQLRGMNIFKDITTASCFNHFQEDGMGLYMIVILTRCWN